MSEAVALQILQLLITVFPPLAELLLRSIPDDDDDPLAAKVRDILHVESASGKARRELERAVTDRPGRQR